MYQRTIRRLCVLVVLALSLALAVPGRADAAPSGPAGLWRWLENFLPERLVLLARAEPLARLPGEAKPADLSKEGGCLDPNGCPKPGNLSSGDGR
jgi:hypothetical protein